MAQHKGDISSSPDTPQSAGHRQLPGVVELIDPTEKGAVLQELEDVCSDPEFRSSQRNCEFLRFVVRESLNGRGEELRERTLGIELFGRPDTYDTSADAVVRVRANDVRKRLIRHYEKISPKSGWQITLPPRSYKAVFKRRIAEQPASLNAPSTADDLEEILQPDPRLLTWRQLLTPTLFALLVCATMFRWQVLASNPFMTFWSTLLAGKSSIDLVIDASPGSSDSVKVSQLQGLSPLIAVAGLFKVDVHFSYNAEQPSVPDLNTLVIHLTQQADSNGAWVEPKHPATLWIQGQGQADLDREIQELTNREQFPLDAAEKVQQSARYFIPLDPKMQLATSGAVSVPTGLPR
jgi:hypothetical protein